MAGNVACESTETAFAYPTATIIYLKKKKAYFPRLGNMSSFPCNGGGFPNTFAMPHRIFHPPRLSTMGTKTCSFTLSP